MVPFKSVQWCVIVILTLVLHSLLIVELNPLITKSNSVRSLKFSEQLNLWKLSGIEDPTVPQVGKY